MFSSSQCRAGRAFLGWSHRRLAIASGISVDDLFKFERGVECASHVPSALKIAFEREGVDFPAEQLAEVVRWRPRGGSRPPFRR